MDDLTFLEHLGGEAGCLRLARDFYARVAKSEELKPLFPGKSVRCATEEFAAFLIQFLDGDEDKTDYRWWLSLSESHARFNITAAQRREWLALMNETLDAAIQDPETRKSLKDFFRKTSKYIIGNGEAEPANGELKDRWARQRTLDQLIDDLRNCHDAQAIELARSFASRRSVLVGIVYRMMELGRHPLIDFVLEVLESDPLLGTSRFNSRTLLHLACSTACLPAVQKMLVDGVDPNILDSGGHAPLYRAASSTSPLAVQVVGALIEAGANVTTALHQAARFGNAEVARALLRAGANPNARDSKGVTPLVRAKNCRRHAVAELLAAQAFA